VARPAGSHCADPDAREPRRRADARRSGCACGGAGLSWPLPAAVIPLVHDGARLDPWDLPACARTLSLELQQNNMHVQINGNGRLRQSILMFLD
jgi:hypothetical protein